MSSWPTARCWRGHVEVDDRAFISGNCLVHQFVRIGTLALMQGGSAISQDLPPFTVARGDNGHLRLEHHRPAPRRLQRRRTPGIEKALSSALSLRPESFRRPWPRPRKEFTSAPAQRLLDFVAASKRGVCRHRGVAVGETTKTSRH